MTDTKPKSRRQLVEQARRAALDGDWLEAAAINLDLLDRFPKDAGTYNRLGRVHLENHRYAAAFEAYSNALKVDPANMIARRNLQRLELLRRTHGADPSADGAEFALPIIPRTNVFIEEVGKTWVDELVNPVSMEQLAEVSSGEQLQMEPQDQRLIVLRADGQRLGEVDAKTAERVLELIAGGNRYEVYALGLSAGSLRIILREVYRDPLQRGKVSFPRQISQTRAYLRERDLLRQRDEADFRFSDDDDEDLDEEETEALAPDEDEPAATEGFEEDPVVVEEEEPRI